MWIRGWEGGGGVVKCANATGRWQLYEVKKATPKVVECHDYQVLSKPREERVQEWRADDKSLPRGNILVVGVARLGFLC